MIAAATHAGTTTTWQINPEPSRVSFAVRKSYLHLIPWTVRGRFTDVAGTILLDAEQPAASHVTATIQAASVVTGKSMRDKHLRGRHFFDVDHFPAITFESCAVPSIDPVAGEYRIKGNLTIHGITRAVELDTRVTSEQDPRLPKLRFSATTMVNRRDFDLDFFSPMFGIGDQITITLDVEAVRGE